MFGPRLLHRLGLILNALEPLPPQSRILDAACGLGQLLEQLQKRGARAFGIDGEIEAAIHARRTTGASVVVGDMTRLPFRNGVFDAITSGETLEHLDDDAAAAREIARLLRAGAKLVVTVPALRMLWTFSDDYYEHRRRYSRKEIVRLLTGAGLNVERANYWGFPLVLLYDYVVGLPMNRRRAKTGDTIPTLARAGKSRGLVGAVRAAFALDRLFSWIPFGPGLILVAFENTIPIRGGKDVGNR